MTFLSCADIHKRTYATLTLLPGRATNTICRNKGGFKLIVTRVLNTAFEIVATVLLAPLFLILIVLPVLICCAVRECLGLVEPEPQNNAIRDEWNKWQAQRMHNRQ